MVSQVCRVSVLDSMTPENALALLQMREGRSPHVLHYLNSRCFNRVKVVVNRVRLEKLAVTSLSDRSVHGHGQKVGRDRFDGLAKSNPGIYTR